MYYKGEPVLVWDQKRNKYCIPARVIKTPPAWEPTGPPPKVVVRAQSGVRLELETYNISRDEREVNPDATYSPVP